MHIKGLTGLGLRSMIYSNWSQQISGVDVGLWRVNLNNSKNIWCNINLHFCKEVIINFNDDFLWLTFVRNELKIPWKRLFFFWKRLSQMNVKDERKVMIKVELDCCSWILVLLHDIFYFAILMSNEKKIRKRKVNGMNFRFT